MRCFRVRQFVSNLTANKKLFIGDYDSYTIIKHGITTDNLLHLTKLGLLLFDKLLLPAAFFWQSDNMSKLLLKLQQPIEYGIMLPVIRDSESTLDISDYFAHRMDESAKLGNIEVFQQPALASEIASKQNQKQVALLKDINSYAHLDNGSIREKYIENWLKDIENRFDIDGLRLLIAQSNTPADELDRIYQLLKEETTHPQFSRATTIQAIQNLIPSGRCQELLIDRASWLYLKSNADAYGSSIYYSKDPVNSLVFEDNLILLSKTLSVFGLTEELITKLSIDQILQIRASSEYLRFIEAYRGLIEKVYTKQENIIAIIQKRIKDQMNRENFFNMIFAPLKTIKAVSSTLFLSLLANHFSNSDINIPLLIGTGSASAISSVLMKFDSVNKAMTSRDFSDFKDYILLEKYEKQILERTGAI